MFNHFQYHTNLFPKIWNHDQTLNPMVRQSLLLMIKEYMFYLARVVKLPVSESDIQDIILHGSITNYYWDKHSDIDICLVLDLSKLREKLSGIDDFFLFQALLHSWENNFYISIYGRKIDIWLLDEKEKQTYLDNTVDTFYSLLQNQWLKKPNHIPHNEIKKIKKIARKKYRVIMRQCKHLIKTNQSHVVIDKYLIDIRKYRSNSSHNSYSMPLTSGVMAFKMARNTGIFHKLRRKAKKELSKQFILN